MVVKEEEGGSKAGIGEKQIFQVKSGSRLANHWTSFIPLIRKDYIRKVCKTLPSPSPDTGEALSRGAHLCAKGQHESSPSGGTVRAATWVPLVTAECVCLLWLRHTGQI